MIIVECCTNWRNLAEAKGMIRVAKECGAGLSKFQLFDSSDDKGKPHYAWVKAHELTFEQAKELFDYGASIDMEVFFSVFGAEYVEWCEKIGVKLYKLACGFRDIKTWKAVASTGKTAFVSQSMPFMTNPAYLPSYVGMNCVSTYPAKGRDYRLATFSSRMLSDHTVGIDFAKIALSRNALVVEKHFCLEHNPDYPDDAWSMTPADLKELVRFEKVVQECL